MLVSLIVCKIPNEKQNLSQKFRLKYINETRNYFLREKK